MLQPLNLTPLIRRQLLVPVTTLSVIRRYFPFQKTGGYNFVIGALSAMIFGITSALYVAISCAPQEAPAPEVVAVVAEKAKQPGIAPMEEAPAAGSTQVVSVVFYSPARTGILWNTSMSSTIAWPLDPQRTWCAVFSQSLLWLDF